MVTETTAKIKEKTTVKTMVEKDFTTDNSNLTGGDGMKG
jgi:hypothetical protein